MSRKLFLLLLCFVLIAPVAGAQTPVPTPSAGTFSIAVADRVLSALRDALLDQNRSRMLAMFDRNRMPGYAEFAVAIEPLFQQYEQKYQSFRVRYQILQTNDDACAAMVEFTLEAIPIDSNLPPVRHSDQLRFKFERLGNDWKIVDVQPRSFFAGF
jgi:hypothetical protein